MINDSVIGGVRFRLRKENLFLSEEEKEIEKKIENTKRVLSNIGTFFNCLGIGSWTITGISLAPFLFSLTKEAVLFFLLFFGTAANAGFDEMEALIQLENMIEKNSITLGANTQIMLKLLIASISITGIGKIGEEVVSRFSYEKKQQEIKMEKSENDELKIMLQELTSDSDLFHLVFIRDFLSNADLTELGSKKTFLLFKELLKYYKVAKLYEEDEATKEELRDAAIKLSDSLAKLDKRFMKREYQDIFLNSYNSQKGR